RGAAFRSPGCPRLSAEHPGRHRGALRGGGCEDDRDRRPGREPGGVRPQRPDQREALKMPLKLSPRQYAEMFGPTKGDRVRLADTNLLVEVERDLIAEGGGYGNEIKFGGGKVIRDGMGQSPTARDAEALDLVITNALVLDPILGVIK